MRRRIVPALMAVILVVGTITYSSHNIAKATTSDDLSTQQEEIDEELKKLREKMGKSSTQLDQLSDEVVDLQAQVAAVQKEMDSLNEQLTEAEEKSKKQHEDMKLRIQYMYENSYQSSWMYLLSASSISEFLNRVEYAKEITSHDKKLAEEYQTTLESIREYKAKLEEKQQMLLAKQNDLQEKQNTLLSQVAKLDKEIDSKQQQSDELSKQIEQMKEYERKLAEEEARKARANAAAVKAEQELAKKQEEELKKKLEEEKKQNQESGGQGATPSPSEYYVDVQPGEFELLAAIIYCEAGGGSYEHQVAVGSVIMNRIKSSSFPNTITDVIYQKGQFSPTRSGRLARVMERGLTTDSCRKAATQVLHGQLNGTWLHFRMIDGVHTGDIYDDDVFY